MRAIRESGSSLREIAFLGDCFAGLWEERWINPRIRVRPSIPFLSPADAPRKGKQNKDEKAARGGTMVFGQEVNVDRPITRVIRELYALNDIRREK